MITSHSEIQTYLTCQRKWYYAFKLQKRPKRFSDALERGINFHEVLAVYYEAKQAGVYHGSCVEAAEEHILWLKRNKSLTWAEVGVLNLLLNRYAVHSKDETGFDILDVEGYYETPIAEGISIGLRLDLLIKYTSGVHKNRYSIWDFKTCYNFWPDSQVLMYPQFPKYAWTLRTLGANLKYGEIRQIRWREDAREKCRNSPVKYDKHVAGTFIDEHVRVSQEIQDLRYIDAKIVSDSVNRSSGIFGSDPCSDCPFFTPCYSNLQNRLEDEQLALDAHFIHNDYGYTEDDSKDKNRVVF